MLRWVKAELLPSHTTGGGRHRILEADLLAFMRSRGIPVPTDMRSEPPCIGIVDDDPVLVDLLVRSVRRMRPGIKVEVARDGFSGGVLVAQHRPDLLLLDIVMPGLGGIEVCRRIRADAKLAGVQVAIISGRIDAAVERDLDELGVRRRLRKPVDLGELRRVLDEVLPLGRAARA